MPSYLAPFHLAQKKLLQLNEVARKAIMEKMAVEKGQLQLKLRKKRIHTLHCTGKTYTVHQHYSKYDTGRPAAKLYKIIYHFAYSVRRATIKSL